MTEPTRDDAGPDHVTPRVRLDGPVVLTDPDPAWARQAAEQVAAIRRALGSTAQLVEHVGSTAVPGLPAKPVLDLLLGVPDPTDEEAYVPALQRLGYQLALREPTWHEHRLLRRAHPATHLHVFATGAPEVVRMLRFRDHLRRDAADRERYARAKRRLAARTWAFTQDYADAKSEIVADILARVEV